MTRLSAQATSITHSVVTKQLDLVQCKTYDVGIFSHAAQQMQMLTLDRPGIFSRVRMLKARNCAGESIYIRPHDPCGLILIDDLSPQSIRDLCHDTDRVLCCVETSTHNWQAWVRVGPPELTRSSLTHAARVWAMCYMGDERAASWHQYGRLAGFTNRKPTRLLPGGRYPYVHCYSPDAIRGGKVA